MHILMVLSLVLTVVTLGFTPALSAPPGVDVLQSLRHAFAYNPQLQQAQESRQQAIHEVRRAEAGFYPTIGVWAGGGMTQGDDMTTRARDQENDVVGTGTTGLKFSQSIWQGGATTATVRSRTATLEARTWQVMDSASTLAYAAVSAHADVLRRQTLLALSTHNVREHQKIFALLQARFAQALSSAGDVEQVRSRLARAEATRVMHRAGLDAALANYMRVTGQPVPARLLPVPMPEIKFLTVDAVREASVQSNFRLQAELANIRSLLSERDYTRSKFSPRLSLDAGPSYSDWGRKGDNYQWTWNAMLNINWDLYSGGADEAGFRAAAAKVREARKALHVTMDALDEEIRVTFSKARAAKEQAAYYNTAKKASRSAKDNFFTQFEAGQKDLLNVLDAENEYFAAAVEECVNTTDATLGQYRLLALAGNILDVTGVDVAALKKAPPATAASDEKFWDFTAGPSPLDPRQGTEDSTLRRPLQ